MVLAGPEHTATSQTTQVLQLGPVTAPHMLRPPLQLLSKENVLLNTLMGWTDAEAIRQKDSLTQRGSQVMATPTQWREGLNDTLKTRKAGSAPPQQAAVRGGLGVNDHTPQPGVRAAGDAAPGKRQLSPLLETLQPRTS